MWTKLADFIIKNRLLLILMIVAVTAFMGYNARKAELNYDFAKIVPKSDPDMIDFMNFKELFGEDGSILAIGIRYLAGASIQSNQPFTLGRLRGVSCLS